MKQLDVLNNIKFVDTAVERIKDDKVKTAWQGLTLIHANKYIPLLDWNINSAKKINFEDWWNGVVLVDFPGNEFTRKDLILSVADQDGGAHVDTKLNEPYTLLSRDNSLGHKHSENGKTWENFQGSHLATIRQIGHEILKTLYPKYTCNSNNYGKGFAFGNIKLIYTVKNPNNPESKKK